MGHCHSLDQLTGQDVLRFIHRQLGQRLPERGMLAGQAVTSVVLYLLGRRQSVHINDYDIFALAARHRPLINAYDDAVYLVRETARVNRPKLQGLTGQDIVDLKREYFLEHDAACSFLNQVELNIFDGLRHLADGEPVPAHCRTRDQIHRSFLGALADKPRLRQFLRERQLIGNRQTHTNYFLERRSAPERYEIQSSRREGKLNHVAVRFPAKLLALPERFTANDGYQIIAQFDLNANQVGVSLATGQLLYTPDFAEFTRSLQLRIVNLNRYWHSLVRYFTKKDDHGYYGLDDCEVDKVMTYHALRNNLGLADSLEDSLTEPTRLNRSFNDRTTHQSPLMGRKYTALLRASRVASYVTLRKATVFEKYGLDLYEALPRDGWRNAMTDGTHKATLERQTGERILGYRSLALATVIPATESRYGLVSAKRHRKLQAMVRSAADGGHLTCHDYAQRQVWSLATQLVTSANRLKGHLNQGEFDRLFAFTCQHPEAIPLFSIAPASQWRALHDTLARIAREDQYAFHQLLRAARELTPKAVLDTPAEALIARFSQVPMRQGGNHLKDKSFENFVYNGVAFEEITEFKRLFTEGHTQSHCVAMYDKDIESHRCLIFSLANLQTRQRTTAELIPYPSCAMRHKDSGQSPNLAESRLHLRQHRGKANSKPDPHNDQVLRSWIDSHNRHVQIRAQHIDRLSASAD